MHVHDNPWAIFPGAVDCRTSFAKRLLGSPPPLVCSPCRRGRRETRRRAGRVRARARSFRAENRTDRDQTGVLYFIGASLPHQTSRDWKPEPRACPSYARLGVGGTIPLVDSRSRAERRFSFVPGRHTCHPEPLLAALIPKFTEC